MKPLLNKVVDGEIEPTSLITHNDSLTDAVEAYERFSKMENGFIKVVLDPKFASKATQKAGQSELSHSV